MLSIWLKLCYIYRSVSGNCHLFSVESSNSWRQYVTPFIYIFDFFHQLFIVLVYRSYQLSRLRIGKESTCQCRRHRRPGFDSWVRKILWSRIWSRKWQPTPAFLPGKFHGQRSLASYSPWGHKELDMTEHTHTHTCRSYTWFVRFISWYFIFGTM